MVFLFLKEGNKNILKDYNNIFTPFNYSDHLHKVLYDKKEITKITQKEKNLIQLEINEHNLNDNSLIYLESTNCYPFIDGYYQSPIQIQIIDENNIQIKKNKSLILEGNSGFMYILSNLHYDYYDINEELSFNFMQSTYDDKESNEHNKLYIFENINMNKFKYNEILKKIIPSIDEIVNKELENFKNCKYVSDINEILNKYFIISIDDLNNENYEKIINIVKKIFEKLNSVFNINKKYEFINYFYKKY